MTKQEFVQQALLLMIKNDSPVGFSNEPLSAQLTKPGSSGTSNEMDRAAARLGNLWEETQGA